MMLIKAYCDSLNMLTAKDSSRSLPQKKKSEIWFPFKALVSFAIVWPRNLVFLSKSLQTEIEWD